MGLFDPITRPLVTAIELIQDRVTDVTDPDPDQEQAQELIAQLLDDSSPSDEIAGVLVDSVEEQIIADLQEAGELDPENVEGVVDQAEGAATALLGAIIGLSLGLETISLGQIDETQGEIAAALTGLGIDDVTGTELNWRMEKGVGPAFEAKVGKEHRSEFVDLPDAVEFALRNKESDDGWLQGSTAPQETVDKIGSNEPVNPDNLIEEWGIRDDQLDILEFVSLEAMEFEELIETPAELGLVVDEEVLDLVLDLAGYPEPLKDFLRQVPDEIPRSNRAWEERTAVEVLVEELDTLAADGELTPAEARAFLPAEVDVAADALQDRWDLVQDPPSGAPPRSLVEDSGFLGFSSVQELEDRLERLEYNTDRYEDVVDAAIYGEIDGDLQEAFALGRISEGTYGQLMDRIGLDGDTQAALMSGQSLSDVVDQRLQEQADPASLPVSSISGVGESRAAGLRAAGIETVADLAQADLQTVEQAAQVETQTAQGFIDQATQRTT